MFYLLINGIEVLRIKFQRLKHTQYTCLELKKCPLSVSVEHGRFNYYYYYLFLFFVCVGGVFKLIAIKIF